MPFPKKLRRVLLVVLAAALLLAIPVVALALIGWPASSHAVRPAELGVPRSQAELEALIDAPGPIEVETIVGARWEVARSGLIDLTHPRVAALVDGPEPIEIAFHAIRHPSRGLFLIDTGVERALMSGEDPLIPGWLAGALNGEAMVVEIDTASWIAAQGEPVAGVFLTHLHFDHVLGLRDIDAPVHLGPGDTALRDPLNLLVSSLYDRALAEHPVYEWRFSRRETDELGVIDVFGDGSFWAISLPGHTPGTTAYLARTPSGPVLFTGDVSHTAWGWENDVPPGTFSHDPEGSAESFALLRALARRHPGIDVRLGHQQLGD